MVMLDVLAYLADAWILGTYLYAATRGRQRPFHWANAIGCLPILAVEVVASAWPAFVLTLAFGFIGCVGVVNDLSRSKIEAASVRVGPDR